VARGAFAVGRRAAAAREAPPIAVRQLPRGRLYRPLSTTQGHYNPGTAAKPSRSTPLDPPPSYRNSKYISVTTRRTTPLRPLRGPRATRGVRSSRTPRLRDCCSGSPRVCSRRADRHCGGAAHRPRRSAGLREHDGRHHHAQHSQALARTRWIPPTHIGPPTLALASRSPAPALLVAPPSARRALAQLYKVLAPFLSHAQLAWSNAIELIQLVDTLEEIRDAIADPEAFVQRLKETHAMQGNL
jgi:hypothetical protein